MKFSKFNYFLILVAVLATLENMIYFNDSNISEIGLYMIAVIIPIILLIQVVYRSNIRTLDNKIPRIIYVIVEVLITLLLVAQITYLIDSLAWLITGNSAVISNITNFGFWFVAVIVIVCVYNLQNREKLIKFSASFIGLFTIVFIPLMLISIISTTTTGINSQYFIGHLESSFVQLLQILPLISILLFVRSKPEEEQKISQVIWPAFAWMLFMLVLAVIAISNVTTADIAANNNYLLTLFESLRQAKILDVFSFDFATIVALYKFMNSVLFILLLVTFKTAIIERKYVYVRQSEYLKEEDARTVYVQKKKQHNVIVFGVVMAIVVPLAHNLFQLNLFVTNIATVAVLVLNAIFITTIALTILNSKTNSKRDKILSLYTAVISIIIFLIYIVGVII